MPKNFRQGRKIAGSSVTFPGTKLPNAVKFNYNIFYIKRIILLFWALYFSIVLASNLTDGMRAAGWLPADIAFASGNYEMVRQVTAIYHTREWLVAILYLGVLAWEGWAAWLFWRAYRSIGLHKSEWKQPVYQAFTISLLLWMTFLLMDELFIAYEVTDLERIHLLLIITQLVTLFAVEFLPEDVGEGVQDR